MKNITLAMMISFFSLSGLCQNNWSLSMAGYDQSYSPADFVTASNDDVYVTGAKYDNGINGFVNKHFKSTNQGASWTEVATSGLADLGNVHTLTISGSNMILGGMDVNTSSVAKIYTSTDNGVNWVLSMTGYDQSYSPADFVTASNEDVYVTGAKYDNDINGFVNKLFKSTNQGASWTEVATSGLADLGNVHTLTISGNKMILGGMDVNTSNGAKIYTSTDNGANWVLSMTGYDQLYSPADFVTASNEDVYVTGAKYDNGINGYVNKLFKSTNQGVSWTEVATSGLTELGNVHTLTMTGNQMILGGMAVNSANGAKIYKSDFSTSSAGVKESNQFENMNVFPNPFVDNFTLEFNSAGNQNKTVSLMSVIGQRLEYINTSNSIVHFETSELPPGPYIVLIQGDMGSKSFNVIKK